MDPVSLNPSLSAGLRVPGIICPISGRRQPLPRSLEEVEKGGLYFSLRGPSL